MAIKKADLAKTEEPREKIVESLVKAWETFIDRNLKAGMRRFVWDVMPAIRTPVTAQERASVRNQVKNLYEAAGWNVLPEYDVPPDDSMRIGREPWELRMPKTQAIQIGWTFS